MVKRHNRFNTIFLISTLFIFGITSVDKAPLLRLMHGDQLCMTYYDVEYNQTSAVCIYWNTTDFFLVYAPQSKQTAVVNWLKTSFQAEITFIASTFPGITFKTELDSGICGYYVWDRIMSQVIFEVVSLRETTPLILC